MGNVGCCFLHQTPRQFSTDVGIATYCDDIGSYHHNDNCIYLSFVLSGDLGGYYGLFLGGSAISLFEILDLIVYNALVKLTTNKRRSQKSRVAPSHRIEVIQVKSADVKESPR
jgi:hypothetical protein